MEAIVRASQWRKAARTDARASIRTIDPRACLRAPRNLSDLHFPLGSWQKPRFLPAETKLMSEKAPQATFSNELGLRRGRAVGGHGGCCRDRGLDPPASMLLGADLIHRTYHGQTFHTAASVCARASPRPSLTPAAAAVVLAISLPDARHHAPVAV